MSVEALDAIKKQVEVLTPQEKSDLANYLSEKNKAASSNEKSNVTESIRQKRMAWLKPNREKYGGQYVVLDADNLLGTAKTFPEAKKIAARAGVSDVFIDYLSKPDEAGFIGGW